MTLLWGNSEEVVQKVILEIFLTFFGGGSGQGCLNCHKQGGALCERSFEGVQDMIWYSRRVE